LAAAAVPMAPRDGGVSTVMPAMTTVVAVPAKARRSALMITLNPNRAGQM
jgi:hypothetical protein